MDKVFCFDLDNTLYLPNTNLLSVIDNNINRFLIDRYSVKENRTYELRKYFYEKYGSTMRGLMEEGNISCINYLEYIHDIDEKLLPKKDENLINILSNIDEKIILITNSHKKYAIKVLKSLGVIDFFYRIFDVVDMGYIYKNDRNSYIKVLEEIKYVPSQCIMLDDIWDFLYTAKSIGIKTVLVNENICNGKPDYHIRNIYELSEIYYEIRK